MFDDDNGSTTTASFSQRSRSSTPSSFKSSRHSKSSKGSNKVTESDFTPRTRRLAIAAKSHVRTAVVYHPGGPFHSVSGRLQKIEFAWTTLKETSNDTKDKEVKDAFKRASKNERTKKMLVTFVSHLSII